MSQTASEAGLRVLYHYDRFNPDYLEDLLVQQRVHCANPATLNDPWDCRPWFDPTILDDTNVRDQFIQWLFSFEPSFAVAEESMRATQIRLHVDSEYRRGLLEAFSKGFLEMIPGRWRIYCLTPVPDSTLMWSHYGDNHRGIALEYSTGNRIFGAAQQVEYLSSYPRWAPQHLVQNLGPHILLTKSDDWQYEREYRVIGLAAGVERPIADHPLLLRDAFLSLPNGALQSIIAGCESDYSTIFELVKKCCPALPVKRAVRAADKYKLEIVT